MAVTTYIITIEDFESRADISENIQTKKIQAQIAPTQEKYAIKILCRDFYEEVLAHIDGTTTVTAVITTLLPFLRDFLVYKTYARYLVGAPVMMTATGPRTQIDTTSDIATDKLISEMIGLARSDANFYQDQLVNFLTLNADDYPTWEDSICGCDDKRRTENNNQFSLVGRNKRETRIDWT